MQAVAAEPEGLIVTLIFTRDATAKELIRLAGEGLAFHPSMRCRISLGGQGRGWGYPSQLAEG